MTNANRIVAIGTSAGGVAALRKLLGAFEESWPVTVFITIHIGRHQSRMPDILNWDRRLPARFAEHQMRFEKGIYIAPPDRHLVIGSTRMFLTSGPTENRTRPAIDPMFRSAAREHGSRVIGVLLTGHLYDGVNGLHEIQRKGGATIVQDPLDAEVPEIPANALARLRPDFVLPLSDMPHTIERILNGQERSEERRSRP